MLVERKIKLVTEQRQIDKPSPMPEYPMRIWSVEIYMLGENDEEYSAGLFTKVTYKLHPSFDNPNQTFSEAPFACQNEGWGEFEMEIDLYTTEKGKISVSHDLNFQQLRYESIHTITFKNPSQALQERLRETGSLPSDGDGRPKKKATGAIGGIMSGQKKKADYERIAAVLEQLEEEDLLNAIQIINTNKDDDTYIKADLDVENLHEAGEFSIDLYTMPEKLTNKLVDFFTSKGLMP